jgi:hypothetical protein
VAEISIQDLLQSARTGQPLASGQREVIKGGARSIGELLGGLMGQDVDIAKGTSKPFDLTMQDILPLIAFGGMAKKVGGRNIIDFNKILKARGKASQAARKERVQKDPPLSETVEQFNARQKREAARIRAEDAAAKGKSPFHTVEETFNAPPKRPEPTVAEAFGPIIKPLPDDAKKAFATVSDTQRGAPEIAMTELVRKGGGSELNGVFEHIGDLTHVLTNEAHISSFRRERVLSKIRNHIGILENPNTPKFLEANFESNAKFAGIPLTIQKNTFKRLTHKYADEHKKVPVFNRPQKLARDAAVAVGEGKYKTAATLLRKLEKIAEDPGTFQQAASAFKKGK